MKQVYIITCSQVLVKTAVHFYEKPFFLATLTSCKAHFKFKFRSGIYIWYFGYYSSSEVSSELLESSKLIINSSVATLGLVLDGLAANAAAEKASPVTTPPALSPVVVVAFLVGVALEALTLLSRCFSHHSREAERDLAWG